MSKINGNRKVVEQKVSEPTLEQKIEGLGRLLNHIVMNKMGSVRAILDGLPNASAELAKFSADLICKYVRAIIEFPQIRSYDNVLSMTWGDLETKVKNWVTIGALRGRESGIPVRFHGDRNREVKVDIFVFFLVLNFVTGYWPRDSDDPDLIGLPVELELNTDAAVINVKSGVPFSPGPFTSAIMIDHYQSKRQAKIRIETVVS